MKRNLRYSPLAAAIALAVAGGAGFAQAPPQPSSVQPSTASQPAMTPPVSNAGSTSQSSRKPGGNAAELAAQDRHFVTTAAEAGAAEVAMGKLAAERASSAEVKAFASHMVTDHTKAGDELKKVAGAKGAQLTEQPSAKDQRELDKLSKLQGADFDREYVKVQLAAHKDAVLLFKKEASAGRDSDLKQLASSTLPTLQEHLQRVQQLSKSPMRTSRSGEMGSRRAPQS